MNPSGVHSVNSSTEEWEYISYLKNFFPDLEIMLYNLFETIKDIVLFFKNLLI